MTWIELRYGEPGDGFRAEELVSYVATLGGYIIQGQQACSLEDHTKPLSLDYCLRKHHTSRRDTKQADNAVMAALVRTGWFREETQLECPATRRPCKGLVLTEEGKKQANG